MMKQSIARTITSRPRHGSRGPASRAVPPRLVSAVRGRIRVHVPEWSGRNERELEHRVREAAGVRRVHANGLTRNILVHFDPALTDADRLVAVVARLARLLGGPMRTVAPGEAGHPAAEPAAATRHVALTGSAHARAAAITPRPASRARIAELVARTTELLELPPLARLLRLLLGERRARWLVAATSLAGILHSLLFASSPLGLVLAGADVVRWLDAVPSARAA